MINAIHIFPCNLGSSNVHSPVNLQSISSYYFTSVAGDLGLQSKFNMFGAVGSIIGIAVIPVCSKFMNNRSIYKLSLGMAAAGYIGMAIIGYGFDGNVYAG